jgi:hypothetical protein
MKIYKNVEYRMLKKVSALFLFLSVTGNSWAGSMVCSGIIDFVLVSRTGNIEVYSTQLYGNTLGRNICNLNTTWKTVTPETCKVWYSTLLAQLAQAKPTKIYYLTEDAETCPLISTYNNAVAPHGVAFAKD